jgi:hypothetical protein
VDKRIAQATAFKMWCQDASIPEAMCACKFTLAESSNSVKQMAVCHAYKKAIGGKAKAPATVSVATKSTGPSLSPLTESPTKKLTAETGMQTPEHREIQLKPKARQIQTMASRMQKWRGNKFDLSDHDKHAFKWATSWYDWELQKGKVGLSWYEISKREKLEFNGACLSARTIQQYANNGLAGQSPLKLGVKSNIPKWVYSSLCMAFESYVCINQLNKRDDVLMLKKLAAKVNETMVPILVDRMPCCCRFMCPFCVLSDSGWCLLTCATVNASHVMKKPILMAFIHVSFVG